MGTDYSQTLEEISNQMKDVGLDLVKSSVYEIHPEYNNLSSFRYLGVNYRWIGPELLSVDGTIYTVIRAEKTITGIGYPIEPEKPPIKQTIKITKEVVKTTSMSDSLALWIAAFTSLAGLVALLVMNHKPATVPSVPMYKDVPPLVHTNGYISISGNTTNDIAFTIFSSARVTNMVIESNTFLRFPTK